MTDQKSRILAAASDLYREEGLDGFSMRKLARRVGVTAPALYRHFDSREEVLIELVSEAHRVLGQHLYRALAGRTPEERMRLAGEGYLDFALAHPRLYDMLYLSPSVLGMACYPDAIEEKLCATGQFWMDRVRECVDAGMLRPGSFEDIGLTLWAHTHGFVSLFLQGSLQVDEAGFRRLIQGSGLRILQGMATREWLESQGVAELPPSGPQRKVG